MPNWCYTCHRLRGPAEALVQICDKINKWTEREYVPSGFGSRWLGNILAGCLIDTGACTAETVTQEYERRSQNTREKREARAKALLDGTAVQGDLSEYDEDYLPHHRGSLTVEARIVNGELCIETETAWNDMAEVFEWVIQKLGLSVECWYIAEELGNGLYYTNDTDGAVFDHSFDFYVSGVLESEDTADGETDYFDDTPQMDREDLLQFCESILGRELDRQMSDEALDAVIAEIKKYNWKNEDSYVNIYRLQRG